MSEEDEPRSGMKSAYELALERLEEQGIERPREQGLNAAIQAEISEIRQTYEAKLAEIEILLQDHLKTPLGPEDRELAEEKYKREKDRLEDKRDAMIAAARAKA